LFFTVQNKVFLAIFNQMLSQQRYKPSIFDTLYNKYLYYIKTQQILYYPKLGNSAANFAIISG